MDRLESLGNQLSQITVYDIKSMYNQAKNMVLNVSEMEAKVREATNDEPWGASSTLMQDIAQGTFNFQQFNEIMPCIYARFMEKEARQWREIYKALQLLEYIIKHGSERVVDDARAHLHTIKMLRNFHYIDDKGKDQGINVRNRSREITELLADVDKIRGERRKAKANRNKYTGTGNEGFDFGGGGGRYDGFGNDSSAYGRGGGSYSGSGGFERNYGRSSSSGFRDAGANRRGFDEYDAGDDEAPRRSSMSSPSNITASTSTSARLPVRANTIADAVTKKNEPKAATREADLIGLGDEDVAPANLPVAATQTVSVVTPINQLDGDDDFTDFQTADPVPAARITPQAPAAKLNLLDMLQSSSPATTPAYGQPMMPAQPQSRQFQNINMNMNTFGAVSPSANRQSFMQSPTYGGSPSLNATSPLPRPGTSSANSSASIGKLPNKPASQSVNFDDLWNMSLSSKTLPSTAPSTPAATTAGKSMKDLEREKLQATMWGSGTGGQFGFGGMGSMSSVGPSTQASAPATSSGADDLLL